mmetsp:Transcript_95972/g.213633  ORF Transcript_95972/g.213633 Transcript_95972/m.213633 type:complete len:136 (-) Transcript_95972:82-489(-)
MAAEIRAEVAGILEGAQLQGDFEEIGGRARHIAERRRAMLARVTETRRKMRELGDKISEQEAMLREGWGAAAPSVDRVDAGAACGSVATEEATAAVPLPGSSRSRPALPQLRGCYHPRAERPGRSAGDEAASIAA